MPALRFDGGTNSLYLDVSGMEHVYPEKSVRWKRLPGMYMLCNVAASERVRQAHRQVVI